MENYLITRIIIRRCSLWQFLNVLNVDMKKKGVVNLENVLNVKVKELLKRYNKRSGLFLRSLLFLLRS
jgi:hypothetical protein